MKALSLSRPWTELILGGIKDVENRSWSTPYRGWLVIHGAKSYDHAAHAVLDELVGDGMVPAEQWAALDSCALHHDAPTGYLGVVRVVDCHKAGDMACSGPEDQERCSPWAFDGSWHWRVTDAHRFVDPIPGGGRLGIFEPPDDVAARVTAICGGILAT